MSRRLVALLAILVAGVWAPGPLTAPARAAAPAPKVLDCEAMPCAAVMPEAIRFRPVEGALHWEGLGASGEVVGWIALSTDFVDIQAYSGKPMVTLVGLDLEGVLTGAEVVHHSEPILLIGIPEQALLDFMDFYAGKRALQRIVVGRANKPDVLSVDAISGATVTVLAQNQTVLETARALGASIGIFEISEVVSGHFIAEPEPWTWAQMLEGGALERLVVSEAEMGQSDAATPVVDLFFGIIDPPQIGRAVLGDHTFEHHIAKLAEGEHLLVIFNQGEGSFKGSAFVRGGIFDRVRLQQGLREITFRDTDYWNMPDARAEGAPEFNEGALFVLRGGRFDPSSAYDLVYLGSRYDHRGAFTRDFREFTVSHQIPETLYEVDATSSGIPWRQAWANRWVECIVLGIYLLGVTAVFAARRYTTADPRRIQQLHIASLVIGFVVLGIWMGAQPSVTQIFTVAGTISDGWRWSLFLSEPLIFMLWIFIVAVSLIWGRGVFCGWVCPYGAMTELAFKITQRLGLKSFELPERLHLPLRHLRYGILVVLVAVFLWDSILAERLAEVEPFKSTFLVPAWTRHWGFLAWWLLLLGISFVWYRPFCRYVCPLGGGLALMSSFRPSGPRRRAFCSSCQICPPGCESRAFRTDGSIDPRECLSCMDCEATYRNETVCPPLVGIARLEGRELGARDREKLDLLQIKVRDV